MLVFLNFSKTTYFRNDYNDFLITIRHFLILWYPYLKLDSILTQTNTDFEIYFYT